MYVYIYIYTHTYIHTYIYYMYVCIQYIVYIYTYTVSVCVCVYIYIYHSSVTKSSLTLCDPVNGSTSLSFIISLSLLKLVYNELVMPSDHLILCRPLLLLPSVFPSIRFFSSGSLHQVAKVLGLQHQSFP